ncbi:carboxypeptidase-like regulatory domain-containing protein [Neolewinella persica]|uniref:carboxypeptidase-like regulatory domain-containing protein n=1 Tax=Neolewinella persica TaxID=70998 RepID=UPI000363A373|nr:carboxypeptidase-like regulatory domain-containing protein [Neolewinella persica]
MSSTNRSTNNLLRRYLTGAITAPEEAELERRALNDPSLAEAMRGLRSAPEEDHAARVSRMLDAARQQRQTGARLVRTRPNRYRWAAAAAILLLMVSSLFLLPYLLDNTTGDLAMESVPQTEKIQTSPGKPSSVSAQPAISGTESNDEALSPSPAPSSPTPDLRPRPKTELKDSPKTSATSRADELKAAARDEVTERRRKETTQKKQQRTTPPPSPAFEAEVIAEEIADDAVVPGTQRTPPPAPAPSVATAPAAAPTSTTDAGAGARLKEALSPAAYGDSAAGYPRNVPRAGAYLDGRITNENGYPIVNALVRLPGLPLGERTDSNGVFQLPADAAATALMISHPDYESEQVDLTNLLEKFQISLERKAFVPEDDRPRWQQNGASTRIVFDEKPGYASPLEGYNALRKRIEANKPAELPSGKVKLSFLVNPDGTLTDVQFRGKPNQATMDYIGKTLVTSSVWEVVQGDEPVRVYFKVVFE